jgi:nickel/cobalt transporter (NicO) family protein
MSALAPTLALAAGTVGVLHTLAPDHWLPIAAVSRARNWNQRRTARVALVCGLGHVSVSVALGMIALVSGTAIVESFGAQSASVAGVLLIGFGVAYALWGMRHWVHEKLHGHHHDHAPRADSRKTAWVLFAIYCADPCIAVIPIIFAAAPLSIVETAVIVAIYELATIATMVGLTTAARAGTTLVQGRWVERYGDSAAGALIAVTGVSVALLGI